MVLTVLSVEIVSGIVEKYGEVRKLNLSSNGVEELEDLSQLSFLRCLDLSCNAIGDVATVSSLKNLVELDLRDNNIATIAPLRKLNQLQRLDISYNSISSMDCLHHLGELQQLVSLDMAGNPVCAAANRYAEILFLTIPSLQTVDGRSRAEVLPANSDPPTNRSSQETSTSSIAEDRRQVDVSPAESSHPVLNDKWAVEQLNREKEDLLDKVGHLENLLVSMERSFSEQEEELSRAAANSEKQKAMREAADSDGAEDAATRADPGAENGRAGTDVNVMSKGFAHLLRLWRRRTLQSLVAKAQLEQELGRAMREIDRTRADYSSTVLEQKATLEAQSKKQARFLSENGELREHISKQEKALQEKQAKVHTLQSGITKRDRDVHLMRLFFEEFRGQIDNNMVNISHKMMQASSSLQLLDARLQSASQRVQLASALVAQKKIHDRNTAASCLARDMSGRLIGAPASPDGEVAFDEADGDGLVELAAEAEALLCSIFRQMDPHDNGFVSIQLLIECLLHQKGALLQLVNSALGGGSLPHVLTVELENMDNDSAFDSAGGWSLHWDACTSWAARLLYILYHIMEQSSVQDEGETATMGDVTWGEFLLLLSISRKSGLSQSNVFSLLKKARSNEQTGDLGAFSTLSRAESLALRRKCLLNDHEWAMIPLAIPLDAKSPDGKVKNPFLPPAWLSSTGTSIESVGRLRQEALRLSKERAFLLTRIQDMNRTLNRRVLASREHFAGEISTASLQEARARSELRMCEQREAEVREKYNELLVTTNTQIERLTTRLDEVEELNAVLQRAEERARTDVESTLHEQLESQRLKHTRLESEHKLLKKESCKMEVLTKTLQRDVQRLQALYNNEAKSRQQYEEKVERNKSELETVAAENETLKERIRALEMENEEIKRQRSADISKIAPPQLPVVSLPEESGVSDESCNDHSPAAPAIGESVAEECRRACRSDDGRNDTRSAGGAAGASGVAIDAVMQKLREWTNKLDEFDD